MEEFKKVSCIQGVLHFKIPSTKFQNLEITHPNFTFRNKFINYFFLNTFLPLIASFLAYFSSVMDILLMLYCLSTGGLL